MGTSSTHHNGLLRFTTAGSVDDGKSTLIGRLLYDSKSIFEDQLEAVEEASKHKGLEVADLSYSGLPQGFCGFGASPLFWSWLGLARWLALGRLS